MVETRDLDLQVWQIEGASFEYRGHGCQIGLNLTPEEEAEHWPTLEMYVGSDKSDLEWFLIGGERVNLFMAAQVAKPYAGGLFAFSEYARSLIAIALYRYIEDQEYENAR